MRCFFALLFIFMCGATHAEELSRDAVYALPLLFRDNETGNEVILLNRAFSHYYEDVFRARYYKALAHHENTQPQPNAIQKVDPSVFGSPDKQVAVAQEGIELEQLRVAEQEKRLTSATETATRNYLREAYEQLDLTIHNLREKESDQSKSSLTSDELIALKEYYLRKQKFFDLLPTFAMIKKFSIPYTANTKMNLDQKLPLAQKIAALLLQNAPSYKIADDDPHAASKDMLTNDLMQYLIQNDTVDDLQSEADFVETPVFQKFLTIKNSIYNGRFQAVEYLYKNSMINWLDKLR